MPDLNKPTSDTHGLRERSTVRTAAAHKASPGSGAQTLTGSRRERDQPLVKPARSAVREKVS